MRAERKPDGRLVGQQRGHPVVQRLDGKGFVHPENARHIARPEPAAVPDLALDVLLLAEQEAAPVRREHEHCVRLSETRQVVKVAVIAVGVVAVGVALPLGRGRHDRHAAARRSQGGHDAGAPLLIHLLRHGVNVAQRALR